MNELIDKNTAINKTRNILKENVVCRNRKQKQSKVFRLICNQVIDICYQHVKDRNLSRNKSIFENASRQAHIDGYTEGLNNGRAQGIKESVEFIKKQCLWKRLWWAVKPKKIEVKVWWN